MEGEGAFGGAKAGGRQDPLVFLKKPIVMVRIAALVSNGALHLIHTLLSTPASPVSCRSPPPFLCLGRCCYHMTSSPEMGPAGKDSWDFAIGIDLICLILLFLRALSWS